MKSKTRNTSAKIIINPKRSNRIYLSYISYGRKAPTILEPSRGGMGIRLNMNSRMFRYAPIMSKLESIPVPINLKIIEKTIASPRFESGPAAPILAMSILGFRRL